MHGIHPSSLGQSLLRRDSSMADKMTCRSWKVSWLRAWRTKNNKLVIIPSFFSHPYHISIKKVLNLKFDVSYLVEWLYQKSIFFYDLNIWVCSVHRNSHQILMVGTSHKWLEKGKSTLYDQNYNNFDLHCRLRLNIKL